MHGFKLWQLLRYIREELLVALGTSSSDPVLPRLLMKLERLGCKKGVAWSCRRDTPSIGTGRRST